MAGRTRSPEPKESEIPIPQEVSIERSFSGIWLSFVRFGLAGLSFLVLYWTVFIGTDVVIKHAVFLMVIFILTAVVYPFSRKQNHRALSFWVDILVIVLTIAASLYAMYDSNERFMRLGSLEPMDVIMGTLLIIVALDVGRRVIGWALTSVSLVLLAYAFFGNLIPGAFGHRGADLSAVVNVVYAGLEGFYGISARMMILYVAPFIIFGAFLEKTGAGEFFIRLAFAMTKNTVGGPAKAAVIGSAMIGSISGSAIANVSSTGVFTIPMMIRVGYKPHVAGAVEAAASTGGQIMPPIMGAIAFLMAEFTQIPYITIATIATMPIILYFSTVFLFIHFEAKKHNIGTSGERAEPVKEVIRGGWHYFFALIIIVVIMGMGYAPGTAALGGIAALLVTHAFKTRGIDLRNLYECMVLGGKYLLSIGSLTGCIGIILSIVGLTGIGLKFSWFFSALSHGSPFIAIVLACLISTVLGMGLASSAAYIITAIAVGPALLDMGFPLVVAHFIMIWFSINSEVTPPVGLAAIVAAGIAKADPWRTMMTSFKFSKGLYILPFVFYYRPEILLQGTLLEFALTSAVTMMALASLAAALEGYLSTHLFIHERILLALTAVPLFIPGRKWDLLGVAIFAFVFIIQKRRSKITPTLGAAEKAVVK
ncbi:MAG: TRAP transporter fused permease subunit [Synergistaceae bacterium]|nr:TRAP transporter fused permease subunit [Synergistaceae bacterium]